MEPDIKPNDQIGYARESLREVLNDPDKTIPGLIFIKTDHIVRMLTRRKEKLPWVFNLIVLAIVIQLPTLMIAILLKEYEQWEKLGLLWMGYIELGLLAVVLTYIDVKFLFGSIKENVLEEIQSIENFNDLQQVLMHARSVKYAMRFTIPFTFFWCISFSQFNSSFIGHFIGLGLMSGTVVFGLLVGSALYMLGWLFVLITHMGLYNYNLHETSPAHSDLIQHLSNIFSKLLYSIAIFIAFGSLAVASNPRNELLVIIIGWIPITAYFIHSQSTISKIISLAKWKTLTRIQKQIKILNAGDITDTNNIEKINRLMDYHERIRATPNSTLNLRTGLNFFNQLALPLLGLLLTKYQEIVDTFSKLIDSFSKLFR
jgi:hypothetical protein